MDQNNIQQDFVEVALKPKASIWFGAESTKWRVLDVDPENQKALLIAEREICEKAYHECPVPVTWIDCSLREWLNGKYFKQSFTKDEQEAIITSRLENRPYTESETNATNITEDKLFLLSCDEIKKYKNVLLEETDNEWWLRTPEMDSAYARYVSRFGNEFSYSTKEEYEAGASAVINNPKALHKIESKDGDDVYYVEETNEFVVLSTDGYIRTYFKPSGGKSYYDRK